MFMQCFASQSRRHAAARGSVLIMVIAILVLMALIGTAFVSVARIDRQASATGGTNVQNNLLLSSVAQEVNSFILNGVFGTPTGVTTPYYRPATDSTNKSLLPNIQSTDATVIYHDYDSPYDDHEAWLASRIPQQEDASQPMAAGNPVVWPSVTLLQNTPLWEAPYTLAAPNIAAGPITLGVLSDKTKTKLSYRFAPTTILVPPVTGVAYPAMAIYQLPPTTPPTLTPLTSMGTVLAADADGDGVADSLYFKLASQPDPNVTYYGAVRIIDNNSAINASTAWSLLNDFDGSQSQPPNYITANLGLFASNVGLEELLRSYVAGAPPSTPPDSSEMDAVTDFRFNWSGTGNFAAKQWPQLDLAAYPAPAEPYDDPAFANTWRTASSSVGARGDYGYLTYGDMLQMNLSRRIDNPGYTYIQGNTNGLLRFQAFSWADSAALAYHFCIPPSNSPSSSVESFLQQTVMDGVGTNASTSTNYPIGPNLTAGSSPSSYAATQAPVSYTASAAAKDGFWYNDNFDFDSVSMLGTVSPITPSGPTCRPLRALLVARNPVSDNVPWDTSINNNNNPQYTGTVANKPRSRANLNTSNYNDLYNAFLQVMDRCDYVTNNPFRNIVGTGATISGVTAALLTGSDVQKLRGGLAAANTMSMRISTYNNEFGPALNSTAVPLATPTNYQKVTLSSGTAYVYGIAPQPFITEVVVNDITVAAGSPKQWVAIKLYNPSTTKPFDLTSSQWQFVSMSGSTLSTIYTFDTTAKIGTNDAIIPPNDYMWCISNASTPSPVISGAAQGNGDTAHTLTAPTGTHVMVATGLDSGYGKIILLVRPVNGTAAIASPPVPTQFAPVDQVDLTGAAINAPAHQARVFYYARTQTGWGCVYPCASTGISDTVITAAELTGPTTDTWRLVGTSAPLEATDDLRQDATVGAYNSAIDALSSSVVWDNSVASTFTLTFLIPLGFDDATYPGPNAVTGGAGNKFPFGGFARDGDAFKIPFIGAYVVTDAGGAITVANGISYDSASADDGDNAAAENTQEHVGQFCPLGDPTATGAPATQLDYDPSTTSTANHRYYFARYLLDYVGAINTPDSDESPNADPETAALNPNSYTKHATAPQDVVNSPNLHPNSTGDTTVNSTWANHDPIATPPAYNNEYDQPNEGLININTAPWPVLAMLPMVTKNITAGDIDQTNNTLLAKAIVAYRDKNGPFTSIFDLNRVFDPTVSPPSLTTKGFINGWGTLTMNASGGSGEPDQSLGDFSNLSSAAVFPRWTITATLPKTVDQNETKNYLNVLTRISNLITTRSDSFTVYIVVEGWKNAGTSTATRVSQVRQAYIVDRSHVSGLNKTLNVIPVPN